MMDDIAAQPQQENFQQPTVPAQAEVPQEIKPKKSKLKKALIIIGVILLICGGFLGTLLIKGVKDAPEVGDKISSFMQHVSDRKYHDAYALTSNDFKEATPVSEFTRAMSIFKAQYTDFQFQEQAGFHIEANAGEPTLYEYTGIITYADGDQGELFAVLVEEGGEYKISYIEVNVPLDRIEKFQKSEQKSVFGVSSHSK